MARYTPNGKLDHSFGNSGKVITDLGNWVALYALLLQKDGKLIIGGNIGSNNITHFILVRYTPNGTIDTSFGDHGEVTTAFPLSKHAGSVVVGDSVSSLRLLSGGKILAVGSGGENFAMARYNSNGSLDTTFGKAGIETTDFGGVSGIQKLLFQANGDFIAAGFAYSDGKSDISLARYHPDGSLDSTFGNQGKILANFGFQDSVIDAAWLKDGEILLVGAANSEQKYVNGFQFFALYHTDGVIASTCGTGGIKDLSNYHIGIKSLILQPDGDAILAGSIGMKFGLEMMQPSFRSCLSP